VKKGSVWVREECSARGRSVPDWPSTASGAGGPPRFLKTHVGERARQFKAGRVIDFTDKTIHTKMVLMCGAAIRSLVVGLWCRQIKKAHENKFCHNRSGFVSKRPDISIKIHKTVINCNCSSFTIRKGLFRGQLHEF
jgi:hypothetical protein